MSEINSTRSRAKALPESASHSRAEDISEALAHARMLAEYGMPVFVGRIRADGNPNTSDDRWRDWQKTRLEDSHDSIDSWKPGEALCGVTGHYYDVLDVDPRHGGDKSLARLRRELGASFPRVYWRVDTPSGGTHLYIAKLDIGSRTGFMPGLDLKGGLPDGTSRGFVFLPPTVRPSKVTGVRSAYATEDGQP